MVRAEFVVEPGNAEVWRSSGEGVKNYVGPVNKVLSLDLDAAERSGNRDIVVEFKVPLWFSTWTSPAEYVSLGRLRDVARFPDRGVHRLELDAWPRFQAWTLAHPALALGAPGGLFIVLVGGWLWRRRPRPKPEGELTDGYSLRERLGAGAMGEVFAATDSAGMKCALKFLRSELTANPRAAERFNREIAASVTLNHPNLLKVFGYGFARDGRLYLSTELLQGRTLKEELKKNDRAPELALDVVEEVGAALAYLQERGVVHRDVKPENIFVRENGGLVLMDLGIAQTANTESLTVAGQAMGSPLYMAPEQVQGKPGPATDQYALGLVLYEILAGRRPFRATDVAALVHQHIHEPPPPPRQLEPRISEAVENALLRMLAKRPEERFATVEEARRAVSEGLAGQRWRRSPAD